MHGSLDVLLTTPLSTVKIYWAKWWGSFRIVVWLTVLPTIVAAGSDVRHILESGGFSQYTLTRIRSNGNPYFLLMPLMIGCYGAGVVSMGLALAIWIKRSGRAMATSVLIYLLLTIGLLFLDVMLNSPQDEFIALGSSLATAELTSECLEVGRENSIPKIMIWCIAYTIAAALISLAACRSFDRCLGRMPDKMSRRFVAERAVRRLQRRAIVSEPLTLVAGGAGTGQPT